MNQIHKELELIVGNTEWENKYRQFHKAIAEFPIENICETFSKTIIGLEKEEIEYIENAFVEYENLLESYEFCKIKLPEANKKYEKIKKEFETFKEKLQELAEKTYRQLTNWKERKEQNARAHILLQNLLKKYSTNHNENQLRQAEQVLESEHQKKLLEYENEQNKIIEEIKTLNQLVKEKNYDLIHTRKYISINQSPHKEKYESVFQMAKKEAEEHFKLLQKKKNIEEKTKEHKQKLEELLKKENLKPFEVLQMKIQIEILKGIYEIEQENFEEYKIRKKIQEKYEKQKKHITEQIEKIQKKSKKQDRQEFFNFINEIVEYKMAHQMWKTIYE